MSAMILIIDNVLFIYVLRCTFFVVERIFNFLIVQGIQVDKHDKQ